MRKPTLLILFLIVFIDLMGFGIVIPLLPFYGEKYGPAPVTFGLLMASYSLMQFLFAPLLGRISDRFGRRPILMISLAFTVAGYLIFAFQQTIVHLFLARIVAGVAGANISTAQAVIADVTEPDERAKGMGLIGAAFGLGFILGPAIGGIALGLGDRAPGLFAAALSAGAFVFALFVLPETRPPQKRTSMEGRVRGWLTIGRLSAALAHPQVGLLMVMFFLATFAFANFESTFALFAEDRLSLDAAHVTRLFVFVGVLAAVIQGGLIGRLSKRYGERRLLFAGALVLLPSYLAMVFSTTLSSTLVFLALLALGAGLTGPSLSSLVSRLSEADEQGGILGVYQSMASLARIIGPFWGVYSLRSLGAAAPYLTAAMAAAVVLVMAIVVLRRQEPDASFHAEPQATLTPPMAPLAPVLPAVTDQAVP